MRKSSALFDRLFGRHRIDALSDELREKTVVLAASSSVDDGHETRRMIEVNDGSDCSKRSGFYFNDFLVIGRVELEKIDDFLDEAGIKNGAHGALGGAHEHENRNCMKSDLDALEPVSAVSE